MKYFVVLLSGIVLLLTFLRLIYILFEPRFMTHKIFKFPNDKWSIAAYYLCAMTLLLILILLKLDLL